MFNQVPYRFRDATIDRNQMEHWNPTIHEVATDYLTNFHTYAAQGLAPMFVGKPGTGKTYAVAAIVNKIRGYYESKGEIAPELCWAPVGEALDTLLAWRDFRDDRYYELDRLLKTAPLAVFDDFAHLRDYPRLKEAFWIYVNARYDRMLPTFFTGNVSLENGWDDLDRQFGEPFRRRIQVMSRGLVALV